MPWPLLVRYAPRDGWLALLADGWRFNDWIVEPMGGWHGTWSILVTKDGGDEIQRNRLCCDCSPEIRVIGPSTRTSRSRR